MTDEAAHVYATAAATVTDWLARIGDSPVVAVDTETSGWDPHVDRLRLIQVSAGPQHPVLVCDAERLDPAILAPLLGNPAVLKVFHHGAFDLRFLTAAGVAVTRVADTMLAQQLLDGGEKPTSGWGLAAIAHYRTGMRLDKSIGATFETGPLTAQQIAYGAADATATWAVFDQQWRELAGHGLVAVAQLEFAALPVLAGLALRGVRLDGDRWRSVVTAVQADLPQVVERLQAALVTDDSPQDLFGPVPINLESPEQVRSALGRLGIALTSTREQALRDHAAHPAVAALLEYREITKVTSNWGGDWAERVTHPKTGRVHADWRQIVGAGRIACSDPNLLQVPKDPRYRACFGGGPGRAMVVADYSQQELRILAAVSGDRVMTELFQRQGDLHRATAAMVFGVPEASVLPSQRNAAKQLNFGLMYGMGAAGLARSTAMSLAQARDVIARYFAAFSGVARWLEEAESTGRRSGRTRTGLGRLRVLGSDGSTAMLARNAPIQGAGADMTKLALAAVGHRLAQRYGSDAYGSGLVLVVHDELVAEVPADDAVAGETLVIEGMLEAARQVLGDVPAVVDSSVRPRWGSVTPPST